MFLDNHNNKTIDSITYQLILLLYVTARYALQESNQVNPTFHIKKVQQHCLQSTQVYKTRIDCLFSLFQKLDYRLDKTLIHITLSEQQLMYYTQKYEAWFLLLFNFNFFVVAYFFNISFELLVSFYSDKVLIYNINSRN